MNQVVGLIAIFCGAGFAGATGAPPWIIGVLLVIIGVGAMFKAPDHG